MTSTNAVLAVLHPSVPSGTPPEAIAKPADALATTIAQQDVRDKFGSPRARTSKWSSR
jgi:hypothetical protein